MHKQYESEAFPYSLSLKAIPAGGARNDYLRFVNNEKIKILDSKQYIDALSKDFAGPARRWRQPSCRAATFALAIDTNPCLRTSVFISKRTAALPHTNDGLETHEGRVLKERPRDARCNGEPTNWERPYVLQSYFTFRRSIWILASMQSREGMTIPIDTRKKNPYPEEKNM